MAKPGRRHGRAGWWGLLLVMLLVAGGCSWGQRFIFRSSSNQLGVPSDRGLSFEELWLPTEDGVRLHAWYIPAVGTGPVVLYFHGNAANISHRLDILDYFHRLGLSVLIFDYRGFGRSEGRSLSEEDVYRDARAAYAALCRKGWRPQQMIYFGRSMGAAPALKLAVEHPPAGVVLEAPFTCLQDIALHLTPITYLLVGWWGTGAMFDNRVLIQQQRAPLLIFHGERDTVVPPAMSRALFALAPSPKRYVSLPAAGHSDAFRTQTDIYGAAWKAFLRQLDQPSVR